MAGAGDSSYAENALQALVGAQLSAVTFVMDYVQLAFDGPTITAHTWPAIEVRGKVITHGEPAYRDELCARIAVTVESVRVPRDAIEIAFADGSTLRISLRVDELSAGCPEAAEFNGAVAITFRPEE